MDTNSPASSRRRALVATGAVALGFALAAGLFVGAGQGASSTAASAPMPEAAPMESVPAVVIPASAGMAAAGVPSASGAAGSSIATAAQDVPEAEEDPTAGMIIKAVDPAEALFGDLPPVAVTN